jgi:hypothetical protein
VKEKRRGPIARAAGLAEGVAATVRRMQREREPRILVYDATGYARIVQPEARGHERLLEIAEAMVGIATGEDVDLRQLPAKEDVEKPKRRERKAASEGSSAGKGRRASGKARSRAKQASSDRKAPSTKRHPKSAGRRRAGRAASEDGG